MFRLVEDIQGLFNSPVKIIPLLGYSRGNEDYEEAKVPIGKVKNSNGLTNEEIRRHLSQGGWVGLIIPRGYILVDIDDKEAGKLVCKAILTLGLKTHIIETPRGWQIFFKSNNRNIRQNSKMMSNCGVVVDYRIQEKGYIVLPSSNTSEREWRYKNSSGELDILPLWLEPLKTATESITIPIQKGARNDTLFRHVCRLRDYIKDENKIRILIDFMNRFLTEEPLPENEIENILSPREGYNYNLEKNEKKKRVVVVLDKFYPRPYAEEITENVSFWYEGGKREFYYFDKESGIWKRDAEDYIRYYFRAITDSISDPQKKVNIINEIVSDVRDLSWKGKLLPEPKKTLIPFKNGVFDLETNEFRNFRADDFFTWKLPHNYNERARCNFLYDFIESLLPSGESITLWELMAYCLWRGYEYQKLFLLFGRGSNGKSTFAKVLEGMLGKENVSHITLKELEDNRFAGAYLYRKLANIAGELEYSEVKNTRLIKQLCGEDMITVEQKYKDKFNYLNYAKLIFLTNEIPKSRDTTDAFYRRLFLIEFPKCFEKQPDFLVKINNLQEEEYEGLLIITLDYLKNLLRRGLLFTKDKNDEEIKREYLRLSSPALQFIEEFCIVTHSNDDYIYKYEFLEKFQRWLSDKGRTSYSENRLKEELESIGIESRQKGESRWWAWIGIKWKN